MQVTLDGEPTAAARLLVNGPSQTMMPQAANGIVS
jgi:hypothetical protein